MPPLRRAVFLDRDGVLNRTAVRDGVPCPPGTLAEVEILPGVAEALQQLRRRGLPLARVLTLVDDHASRPLFGLAGEKSINVLELNIALDKEGSR